MTSSIYADKLFLANFMQFAIAVRREMSKIADAQLRSKAAILAEGGYSYSPLGPIGDELGRSKGWVAKWVERSKQGELGDHARCGRPKILTQAAIKIIKKAKY